MADVKWIKITTEMFDDEKILLIESLPSADSIIVIWFKLLVLAGKQNNNGVFLMNNSIPYTDEMLAVIFRRDINVVRLALKAFVKYGMVEIVENVITIPKWNKHQSLDLYAKKKEYDRQYQEKRRKEQKLLIEQKNRTKSYDESYDVVITDIDKDKEIDIDKDKENKECKVDKPAKRARYGTYKNVLLSAEEMEKLQEEFPYDYQERIELLSEYIASSGKTYKNFLATIRRWARTEKGKGNTRDLASVAAEVQAMLDEDGGIW